MQITKARVLRVALIAMGALAALFLTVSIGHGLIYRNRIYPGVRIDGLDVGGLSVEDAAAKADRFFTPTDDIKFAFKDKQWPIDLKEIGAKVKAVKSAKLAFTVGRRHGLSADLGERYHAWASGIGLPVEWSIDRIKTTAALKKMAKVIDQPPQDAQLLISQKNVSIQPHRDGRRLLYRESVKRIETRLSRETTEIPLAVKVEVPAKTTEAIKKLKVEKLMSEFSTSLASGDSGRRHNIQLAMDKLDGTYVPPGTVFSFNNVVGPRTRKAGFTDAPVIERGQLVQGIGGGICQVATTLYNAAMISGLPITSRSVHSNFISHYPAGRDATVVDGAVDFKFRNDTDGTLVIKTQVTSNATIFRIYGPNTGRVNWFSEPEFLDLTPYSSKTETDSALPAGAKIRDQVGVDGRTVKVRRKVTVNGKVLIDETIVSRYTPRQEVIKVGPAPPPPPPVETSATPLGQTTTGTP